MVEALRMGETTAAVAARAKRGREESGAPTCLAGRVRERAKAMTRGDARMLPTLSGVLTDGTTL